MEQCSQSAASPEWNHFRVTSLTDEAASRLTIKLSEDDKLKVVEPQILEDRLQANANIALLELLLVSLRQGFSTLKGSAG